MLGTNSLDSSHSQPSVNESVQQSAELRSQFAEADSRELYGLFGVNTEFFVLVGGSFDKSTVEKYILDILKLPECFLNVRNTVFCA